MDAKDNWDERFGALVSCTLMPLLQWRTQFLLKLKLQACNYGGHQGKIIWDIHGKDWLKLVLDFFRFLFKFVVYNFENLVFLQHFK